MISQGPLNWNRKKWAIVALIIAFPFVLPLKAAPVENAEAPSKYPFAYKKYHVQYDLNADGSYSELGELVIEVVAEQGVEKAGHFLVGLPNILRTKSKRDIDVIHAYTLKKGGEHINASVVDPQQDNSLVPVEDFPPDISSQMQGKIVAFPNVEVGDALVVSYKARQKEAELPNGIYINRLFPRYQEYDDVLISVTHPLSLKLRIETVGVNKVESKETGKRRRTTWKFKNQVPEAYQPNKPQSIFSMPAIHISSFSTKAAEMAAIRNQEMASRTFMPRSHRVRGNVVGTQILPDRALDEAVPRNYHPPQSEWRETEKEIYRKVLSNGRYDTLIVPFQVQDYALDRATRSLMTAELATAVAETQNWRVPDPYIVARALGDGERRLDTEEVYQFAKNIGVKKIVWGYVGHNRNDQMRLSIVTQSRDEHGVWNIGSPSVTKNFVNISYSDEIPPVDVYTSLLPDVVMAISGEKNKAVSQKIRSAFDAEKAQLPSSPLEMVADNTDAARTALYYQLLAYLTPVASERAKERFAEKSLRSIYSLSTVSRDYRLLKARALMLLNLRTAALHILGEAKTVAERELEAALNGNLTDVERYASKMKPGIERIMAMLDGNNISGVYGGANKKAAVNSVLSLKIPGEAWQLLVLRAFTDGDVWAQYDNSQYKKLLDRDFPIKNYTLEGIRRGTASLGGANNLEIIEDLSIVNHARKAFDIDSEKRCCHQDTTRLTALDYMDVIEAIGEDNIMRRAKYLTEAQGAPERTLEYLGQLETVYKGNPRFALARATAQMRRAEAVDGAEMTGLLKSAYANLFNAMYWEQGQTKVSAAAFDLIPDTGRHDYGYYDNFYAGDYPYHSYYPYWEQGGSQKYWEPNAEAALKNSTADLRALNYLNEMYSNISDQETREKKLDALFGSIKGRFSGSTEVYELRARNSVAKGDVRLAQKYYRDAIQLQPGGWQAYFNLGTLLIEHGDMKGAANLFMTYPGFRKGSQENPVSIAAEAHEAGSKFYWMGEFSMALPFYEISSRRHTGSDSDICSYVHLKLINGDVKSALFGSLERAKRYNDTRGYRDYLGMLHAMGYQKEAWDAFNMLARQFNAPYIWETALVGHRKEGKTEAEIVAWVKENVAHDIGKEYNWAANYLLRAGVTDRIPSSTLSKSLFDIARPVWQNHYPNRWVVLEAMDGNEYIQGPRLTASNRSEILADTEHKGPQRTRVKPSIVYFAEAYRAIRIGEFAKAKAMLQEASTFYDMSKAGNYLLPYYAFASARAGDVSGVNEYMADFKPTEKGFDYFLAQAAIAGVNGQTEPAINLLKSALYRRPLTEGRPLQTEFEYAEILEWLYEATGDTNYSGLALDWAKKNQRFQPWFAWAYAMEALLSHKKVDRRRAIAMSFYLDPKSEMLERIPKEERDIAIKEFKDINPFVMKDESPNPDTI